MTTVGERGTHYWYGYCCDSRDGGGSFVRLFVRSFVRSLLCCELTILGRYSGSGNSCSGFLVFVFLVFVSLGVGRISEDPRVRVKVFPVSSRVRCACCLLCFCEMRCSGVGCSELIRCVLVNLRRRRSCSKREWS